MTRRNERLHVPRVEVPREPADLVRERARRRSGAVGALFALGLTIVGARGVMLCTMPDDRVVALGMQQRWGRVVVEVPRGEILDQSGHRLATSVLTPTIAVDPSLVEPGSIPELSDSVAAILDIPVEQVADAMRCTGRYAIVAPRVHPAQAVRIKALKQRPGEEGKLYRPFIVERNYRRYYPEGELASQLLGFVDNSAVGQSGVEAAFDEYLSGTAVVEHRRRDSRGLRVDDGTHQSGSIRGMNVHTTVDRMLQLAAERALQGVVERSEPLSASIVVVDVDSGDILAMAHAPTFNPNAMSDADSYYRRNRAVRDAVEPGSVFKPFTVAAALDLDVVDLDDVLTAGASYRIGRSTIHDDHPHDLVTVSEVVKYSSNIGVAKLALQVGADRLVPYLNAFGFGVQSGISLPGEPSGVLRSAGRIKPIELATTSYGQGVTATTLQLAMATATIANHGVRMEPRLVTLVEDSHGVPALVNPPRAAQQVISPQTALEVTHAMITVTEEGGTGTGARVPGYRVAGKTGTAWKVTDGVYGSARIASFIGFLPADDPEIAIAVVVDEPSRGSRYGGIAAAPAFVEVAQTAMSRFGIAPDPELLAVAPEERQDLRPVVVEPVSVLWDGVAWTLPDLSGRSVRDVLASLQGTGVQLELDGAGFVVDQVPVAGGSVIPGGTVKVTFQ